MAIVIEKISLYSEELVNSSQMIPEESEEVLKIETIKEFLIVCLQKTPTYSVRSLISIIEDLKGYKLEELLMGKKDIFTILP